MESERILDGLNAEQRRAAEAVRGPVCILAGAGSGKTTTITRRIANQVASGAFAPTEILAVTFTDKAAGEMRGRLRALGVERVQARTFHSAALRQLTYFSREPVPEILPSKALMLKALARSLPAPYCFRPVRDLATEVEWAKNRRLTPESYLGGLGSHEPPVPPDLMLRVFSSYERRKAAAGRIDFEDVLELTLRLFDSDTDARERFRAQYRAFTVDEYQDVNLLQQELLERWLGERDELCVVGDDYQSIYSFTGATPRYLLDFERRFPAATVIRLEENYRSTPEVLAFANRLVPKLGGSRKTLSAVRAGGPEPSVNVLASREREAAFVVERVRELAAAGVPHEETAVLYRINARSDEFEEAFAEAGIPFQVRDGAFLTRPGARNALRALRRAAASTGVAAAIAEVARRHGLVDAPPEGIGAEEATRQADLTRLVRLAEEFDDGTRTVADFAADLDARFGDASEARGVNLLTYHRAKGLEFTAVFLPRLEEGELPFGRKPSAEAVDEERRLFYVGLTRAKEHLVLSSVAGQKPSRFLAELGETIGVETVREEKEPDSEGVKALKAWRLERARADAVPAYVVFHDRTLAEIAGRRPRTRDELATVPGVGPAKLDRYGDEVLAAIGGQG